jgi:hypothetical protein
MAAAELYSEYRDVLDLRMPEAFDPAGIITAARQIFQDSPAFLAAERERLQLILVDDAQESNPAVFELLADVAEGKDVVVTYSPDTVVQGFRGARPDLVAELPPCWAARNTECLERPLWVTHRHTPGVAGPGPGWRTEFPSAPAANWPGAWNNRPSRKAATVPAGPGWPGRGARAAVRRS